MSNIKNNGSPMAVFSGGYFTLLGKSVLENDPSYPFI